MHQKISTPATADAVALLTRALSEGHSVVLSLGTPPLVVHPAPLVTSCCLRFGMTPSEARVTVALLEHGYVGREDLRNAMCDGKGTPKLKTVDVIITRVRRKLKPHEVGIETIWGAGYRIDEGGRDRLRQLLADEVPAPAGGTA